MAELMELKRRDSFAGWPKLIFWAGMIVFTFYACTHMVAAGDTWVALACGKHFANHGVDTVEPFSANSHKAGPSEVQLEKFPEWSHGMIKKIHPTGWVNQNWLTHTMFYWLSTTFGSDGEYNLNTMVYWKFAVNLIAAFSIYYFARLLGVSAPGSAAAAAIAMVIGRTFIDIRPAVHGNVMVAAFLLVLALATYRNIKFIWLTVPITVLWSNLHGGYIYVFIMLTAFIGIHLLAALPQRWTVGLHGIGTMLVLYLFSYKFVHDDMYITMQQAAKRTAYTPPGFLSGGVFILLLVLIVLAGAILFWKKAKDKQVYVFSATAVVILFLAVIDRMSPSVPSNLNLEFTKQVKHFLLFSKVSLLACFILIVISGVILAFYKRSLVKIKLNRLLHPVGAGFAAFFAMIIFNPFHLTNLTHTFEISLSEHAESWRKVNEWKPAFDRGNPVGEENAFVVMFCIGLVVLMVWGLIMFLKPRIEARQDVEISEGNYAWPKIDLALLAITALTVYMAIKSRRFIPLAAFAACPVIAMFIEQAVSMVLARNYFNKKQELSLPEFPKSLRTGVIVVGAVAAVVFGAAWGGKYKRIYLDPWAADDIRDSVFMRMTASNLKPIDACTFIRENEMSGNMFNYWTEGGAIAFGQEPDAETGKTPLQLFMDGRAQAAYDHETYKLWQWIYAGGSNTAIKARQSRRMATNKEFKEIATWLDEYMKSKDIWVFMAPNSQFVRPGKTQWDMTNYLPLSLPMHPDWQCVYLDSYQQIYVDVGTGKGKKLYSDMLAGKAKYPNEFSMNLTLGRTYLRYSNADMSRKGFEHAKKAFTADPCFAPMQQLVNDAARQHAHLRGQANEFIEEYLKDFIAKRETLRNEKGYLKKLDAAWGASKYLTGVYAKSDAKLAKEYDAFFEDFLKERKDISTAARW